MRKTTTSLSKIIADLTKGHGSQKLSPSLRKIEIESIPSSGAHSSHRQFVQKVLPRIKYNNESIEIDVRWIEKVKKGKAKSTDAAAVETQSSTQIGKSESITSASKDISESIQKSSRMPVRARLLFDGLPTREVNLNKSASVSEITNDILRIIRETTGETEREFPSSQ